MSKTHKRAIKRIKKQSTWEGLRTMRELRSLLSLSPHANIVQLLEVIREDRFIHFVFELMPGGSLKEAISHRNDHQMPPLPTNDGLWILNQVLSGVKHLHDCQIYHRDLKPGTRTTDTSPNAHGTSSHTSHWEILQKIYCCMAKSPRWPISPWPEAFTR
jgi:serine/threonine protein kinase